MKRRVDSLPDVRWSTSKKWTANMPERAYALSILGCTDKEIALVLDVKIATIDNWKIRKPEFNEAIRRGKLEATAQVALSLYKMACGYTVIEEQLNYGKEGNIQSSIKKEKYILPSAAAQIFLLKNKTRNMDNRWSDVHNLEHTGKDGSPLYTEEQKEQAKTISTSHLQLLKELYPELPSILPTLTQQDMDTIK